MSGKTPDLNEVYKYGMFMQALWKLFNRTSKIGSENLISAPGIAQFNAVIRRGLKGEHDTDIRTVEFHFKPYLNAEGSSLGITDGSYRNEEINSREFLTPFYKDGDIKDANKFIKNEELQTARGNFDNNTLEIFRNIWKVANDAINIQNQGSRGNLYWKWGNTGSENIESAHPNNTHDNWNVAAALKNGSPSVNLAGDNSRIIQTDNGNIQYNKTVEDKNNQCYFMNDTNDKNGQDHARFSSACTVNNSDLLTSNGQLAFVKRSRFSGYRWHRLGFGDAKNNWIQYSPDTRSLSANFDLELERSVGPYPRNAQSRPIKVIDKIEDVDGVATPLTKKIELGEAWGNDSQVELIKHDANAGARKKGEEGLEGTNAVEFWLTPGIEITDGRGFDKTNKINIQNRNSTTSKEGITTKTGDVTTKEFEHSHKLNIKKNWGVLAKLVPSVSAEIENELRRKSITETHDTMDTLEEINIFSEDTISEESSKRHTRDFTVKWTGPSADDFEKAEAEGGKVWPITWTGLDENGREVEKELGLVPYAKYAFQFVHTNTSIVVPPLNTYYAVEGRPGDFNIASTTISENSLREAVAWAKRANFQEVLGYAYDPFSLPSNPKNDSVIVGSQIIFSGLDNITHGSTVRLELFKIDSPDNFKGRARNSQNQSLNLSLDDDEYNQKERNDLPGEFINYSKYKGNINVRDDNSDQLDRFAMGRGDDLVYLHGGKDIVDLGAGDDKVKTTKSQEEVSADGGKGNDIFIQNAKLGSYEGEAGNDHFIVKNGLSYFDGGNGKDVLQVKRKGNLKTTFSDFVPGEDRIIGKGIENYNLSYKSDLGIISLSKGQTNINLHIGQSFIEDSGNTDSDWIELSLANIDKFEFNDIVSDWPYRDFNALSMDYARSARSEFVTDKVTDQTFDLLTVNEFKKKITSPKRDHIISRMVDGLSSGHTFSETVLENISDNVIQWIEAKDPMLPSEVAKFINKNLESAYLASNELT